MRYGVRIAFFLVTSVVTLHVAAGPVSSDGSARTLTLGQTRAAESKSISATNSSGGCTAFEPNQDSASAPSHSSKDDTRAAATRLLASFFGLGNSAVPPPGVHYVIALTPDPIHTNLSLLFDRQMVAIQQAAQDEGFTYNSSWLPWREESRSLSSLSDRQAEAELIAERESCPGILLFRRSISGVLRTPLLQPVSDSLVVFVVGEQPTGGLNHDQWINVIHWLATNGSSPVPGSSLRILGPTFSGSLVSLERSLDRVYFRGQSIDADSAAFRVKFPAARILSGSVRSCTSIRWFRQQLEERFNGAVRFGTFQENDALQINRLLRYLSHQGTLGKDVAILAEDETAYANTYLDGDRGEKKPNAPACDFPYDAENRPLHISYPRDISALRSAYEKQSIFNAAGPAERSARAILQESGATDSTEAADTIPSFGGPLTPIDQEAVLYGVVSYLRTHHTRYVLLRCSNQLDFIFLTRFFHRAYPEGRVVTVGADLLFRREIDSTEFRGVMSLSTYPLLPREQHWTALFQKSADSSSLHTHRVFEDQSQQGQYIAARYLFDSKVDMDGLPFTLPFKLNIPSYAEPFWFSRSGDAEPNTSAPTWLSVVGRDGYWPIAVLNDVSTPQISLAATGVHVPPPQSQIVQVVSNPAARYDHDRDDPTRLSNGILFSPSLSWKIITGCSIFLLFYQSIALGFGTEHAATRLLAGFRKVSSPWQSLLIGLNCCFAVMLLLEPLSILLALPHLEDLAPENAAVWISLVLAVVSVFALSALLHHRYPSTGIRTFFVSIVIFVSISTMTLWLSAKSSSVISANDLPLAIRMAHPTAGVSPLLPVLFLFWGFYLWSWQTMAGNVLLCGSRPLLPRLHRQQIQFGWGNSWRKFRGAPAITLDSGHCRLRAAQFSLSDEVGRRIIHVAAPFSLPVPVLVPTVFLFFGSFLYFHRDLPLLTMEGHAFSLCVNIALLIAYLLTTAEAARLFATWGELQRLLIALNQTRLRRTFACLHAVDAHSLWSVSGNVDRVQAHFFFQQLDAGIRLLQLRKDLSPSVRAAVVLGRRFSRVNAGSVESGDTWEVPLRLAHPIGDRTIRDVFSDATADVLNEVLLPAWLHESTSLNVDVIAQGEKNSPAMELSTDGAVCAAEEFVCFHYISFIQNILARMRTMTLSMATLFISVCLAISFYPFVPRTEIGIWMIADLAIICIPVVYVYAAMERDVTLSYIANTPPGRLTSAFWLKSAGFLAGPVIGILTTQFPAIADSVLAWVQPGLDAISR
jgi:hypothetical protein